VPDGDAPPLLCTQAQLTDGAFGDLVSLYPAAGITDVLAEATRTCEDWADRRLAPFTITETSRASGIDPDEYGGSSDMPMSIQGTLGMSQAASLNMTNLVRHHWVREYPSRYQDLWAYSNVTVTVIRSYGGIQQLSAGQILQGPDDTGHLWWQLGQFIPVGSRIQVQYSGGYVVAVPAGLTRAARFFAASFVVRELDPGDTNHNPDQLWNDGLRSLAPFGRDGSPVHLAVTGRLR
jgi:hypothetical protein